MGVPYLHITDETLYAGVALAIPAWLMLMFVPNHLRRQEVVRYTILGCCVLYTLCMSNMIWSKGYSFFADLRQTGNLHGVRNLLANRDAALPAWLHFVAFDLWVANKVTDDNYMGGGGLPQWRMIGGLALMASFGPAGFLVYVLATQFWPQVRGTVNRERATHGGIGGMGGNRVTGKTL